MLYALIGACEVGFWVVLGAGLAARYLLRRPRLGAVLLLCVPLVDVVLLVATAVDLHRGVTAGPAHGLAAAYLGFSVAFGHSMVRWADHRFAHRFAGGPPPWRPPEAGRARARYEWREWGKAVLAAAIACVLLGVGILLVGDPGRSAALLAWIYRLGAVVAIWFVAFPLWASLSVWRAAPHRHPG